jgi:uncharacterized membrane protein
MVLHHVVDAWVRPEARTGPLYAGLRHLGGLPAPGFLVLAGVSGALVLARERTRGIAPSARARAALGRGLYVLGIAYAFRVFAFVAGGNPLSAWRAMFRVDVLNCLGAGLCLVGGLVALARSARAATGLAAGLAAAILLATPFVYGRTVEFPSDLVGFYIAGQGPLALFPLFPWLGLLAAGFVLGERLDVALRDTDRDADRDVDPDLALRRATRLWAPGGLAVFLVGAALAGAPFALYPPHDFWHASPLYFAMRLALQVALLGVAFTLVPRLPAAARAGNPLALLGRHSLLAYVLHLELAYGRLAGPLQRQVAIPVALAGSAVLLVLCWAAAALAERSPPTLRTRSVPRTAVGRAPPGP